MIDYSLTAGPMQAMSIEDLRRGLAEARSRTNGHDRWAVLCEKIFAELERRK